LSFTKHLVNNWQLLLLAQPIGAGTNFSHSSVQLLSVAASL